MARAILLGNSARQRRPGNVIDGESSAVPNKRPVNEVVEQLFD